MNENNNLSKADSEVDLMAVFQKLAAAIGKFLKDCAHLAGMAILFLVRKSLWLLVFLCIGLILAFAQYSTNMRYYASTLTAQVNVLTHSS